ncbi:protein FAM83D-B-like [Chiloscyllium plagiosum]|uniref:protein FAM83D-B-like n=1 Tax=Chiloscyllium plagiosum TaxID=36176 RepID=UPI001CB83617|nr:protein FAM83D-B-like [Chiloscyllium plagiosum]
MNDSQCLDDLPIVSRWCGAPRQELGLREFYSETQRLALEELIAGGEGAYSAFLKRERAQGFLSADEIASILQSTISPPGLESQTLEQSFTGSNDLSSGTYFPDASDTEVPVLDIGWPDYPSNWYRGVTQVEVYFQPSYGELIYSCKEAIRKLIRKAEKVIALVMDTFTDIDILKDLHEACRRRRVPVYILLDQSGLPLFQKMCRDAGVQVEEERKMRVRTITGCTYCTRTGAKVIGRVHEKFMLIDCDKVATGSYSFTWTDGKLNRSNLTVLSGQLSEFYDEEFRILYAQSQPIPTQSADFRNCAIYEEIAAKRLVSRQPTASNAVNRQIVPCSPLKCKHKVVDQTAEKKPCSQTSVGSADSHVSETSTLSDKAPHRTKDVKSVSIQTDLEVQPGTVMHNTSTQTCIVLKDVETQTALLSKSSSTQTYTCTRIGAQAETFTAPAPLSVTEQSDTDGCPAIGKSTDTPDQPPPSPTESSDGSSRSSSSATSEGQQCHNSASYHHAGLHSTNSTLRNCFQKLTKERQFHYITIRSKLDSMVAILSRSRHLNKFHSHELDQYNVRGSRELMSRNRVLGFREVSALASLALRN